MLFIDYFEDWKDIVVFLKGFKCFLLELEEEIKLCYVVNFYIKFEELNGEFVYDLMDKKYRVNLFFEGKGIFKIIGKICLGYLEGLLEVLKIFIYRCLVL